MESVLVHQNLYDPRNNFLFKAKANDRAECQEIKCSLSGECPLRKAGMCASSGMFNHHCPYGERRVEQGPTKRSGKITEWVSKKRVPGVPFLKSSGKKMALIGDYVYLPYSFMDMCDAVPFLQKSSLFVSGRPFLPIASWTIETVLTLLDFRPRSLMGEVIRDYQKESVPLFVLHLRSVDPAMFAELLKHRSDYDVAPNYVGRSAILKTLNSPIAWSTGGKYSVSWEWNGTTVRTTSHHAYNSTWGEVKPKEMTIELTPEDRATLKVQSNDWVNEATEFVD